MTIENRYLSYAGHDKKLAAILAMNQLENKELFEVNTVSAGISFITKVEQLGLPMPTQNFLRENPHIIFDWAKLPDQNHQPILNYSQARQLLASFDANVASHFYWQVLNSLITNLTLYALVEDEQGSLARWEYPTDTSPLPPKQLVDDKEYLDVMYTALRQYVTEVNPVTWWSRLAGSSGHYSRQGTRILRQTNLENIKKAGNHVIGLDTVELAALVLVQQQT